MKASPVSFGRAIRINASVPVAKKIAEIANNSGLVSESVTEKGKSCALMAQTIFGDTYLPNGKAKVLELGKNEVYIFSGKEVANATSLLKEAKDIVKQDRDFVEMLPDRMMREARKAQYDRKHSCLEFYTKQKIRNLVENGGRNPRMSAIDVDVETIDSEIFGKREKIRSVTYASINGNSKELSKFEIDTIV